MNVTPKTHAMQVRSAAARKSAAVKDVRVLAYSCKTGDPSVSERIAAMRARHEATNGHVMDVIEADLPGDRTIGYCSCGEYMDTGTWDERNA